MWTYLVKRFMQGILLIFTVSFLVFSLIYLMPGDPVELMTGERVAEERKDEMRAELGLDKPLWEQYWNWLTDAVRFEFGNSIKTKLPVRDTIMSRLPVTLKLGGISLLLEVLIAVPLGLLAAYKKDSIFDRLLMAIASFFQAVPNFWLAILMLLLFSVTLHWLPLSGYQTASHFILPVASLVLTGMAGLIRMTKAEVMEVFREKYVLTAYAKGLPRNKVIIWHVLRNALILVVVMVSMSLPWIVSGSVIIENVFVIPGIGSILTKSISTQDFPIVQACVLMITVLTAACNLACDYITALLDPRIRVELSGGGQ